MEIFEAYEQPMDDGNPSIEAILEQNDPFIILQAREVVRQNPNMAHSAVLDLEVSELAQRVRIKFWQALTRRHIEYVKAYIRRIVRSEFIDMMRRKKPLYSLSQLVDEYGELYQGDMLISPSDGMADPAEVVEQEVAGELCMKAVAEAVLQLHHRQKRVMICELRDRVENLLQLEETLRTQQIAIDTFQWPAEKSEKQLLKASLSAARFNVAKHLKDTVHSQAVYV